MYKKMVLIRFGELSLKGRNQRYFIQRLSDNIFTIVGERPISYENRLLLENVPQALEKLPYIFGVSSYSEAYLVTSDLSILGDATVFLIKEFLKKTPVKNFRIIATRHDKSFPLKSMEIAAKIGGIVAEKTGLAVNLKTPELTVILEVHHYDTIICFEKIPGLGGLPVGVSGKVLHLISGGIDSPVAAFELMKRGVHVDFLNFITPPQTDERTIDKVNRIIELLMKYQGQGKLFRVTYTKLMNLISLTSDESYRIVLMRRSFYRIASLWALKEGYLAIGNGESIGQVASQTLEAMSVIGNATNLPILRPLVTADKQETIAKAIKIGTYELSVEKCAETCELFAPESPTTRPKLTIAVSLEKELDELEELEKLAIDSGMEIQKFVVDKTI